MSDMFSPYATFAVQTLKGRRLGKRFVWASGHAGGVFPEDATEEDLFDGRWGTPNEVFGGADLNGTEETKYQVLCFDRISTAQAKADGIQYRYELRKFFLTAPKISFVLGIPNETIQAHARKAQEDDGVQLSFLGEYPRNNTTFIDAPRAYLTMDIDKLAVHENVLENDHMIEAWIRDVIDASDLEWLQKKMLVQFSSGHGIKNDEVISAHVEWHLAEPLTLAQQKQVATYCNQRAYAAGYGEPFDTAIYEPSRLLYTAPPELFYRQRVNGLIQNFPMRDTIEQRVRIYSNGDATPVEVPKEALCEDNKPVWMPITTPQKRKEIREAKQFAPGSVHVPTRDHICAAVLGTPKRHWRKAMQDTYNYIEAQIERLPATPSKYASRIKDLRTNFEKSWEGAAALRYGRVGPAAALRNEDERSLSLAHAREVLRRHIERYMQDAIEYKWQREDVRTITVPVPTFTAVQVPPGVGKTTQLVSAITHTTLYDSKTDIRTPSLDLSRQIYEALQEKFKGDEDALSKILFEQGRSQFCVPEMDPRCQRVEAMGISPRNSVCVGCRHFEDCGWIKQGENETATLRIGQHAHITSSLAAVRSSDSEKIADIYFIDENPFTTFAGKARPKYKLETLAKEARSTSLLDKRGRRRTEDTADLQAFRRTALEVLDNRHGKLPIELVSDWHWIDAAIDLEEQAAKQAWAAIMNLFKADGEIDEDELQYQDRQKKCAELFLDIFTAIQENQGIAGRKYVFGLSLSHGHVDVAIRNPLPVPYRARNVVLLDATANPLLDVATWGKTHELDQMTLNVGDGAYKLTQYMDSEYANSKFLSNTKTCRDNMRKLVGIILRARHEHGQVLVTGPKKVLTALKKTNMLPRKGVALKHYTALRGLNAFERVPCLIAIGRHMPPMDELETMTEGYFYDAPNVPELKLLGNKPLPKRRTTRKLRNGRAIVINERFHPDPHVDAVMRQHTDAECIQAIHRARIVNRTKDNPVHLIVLGTFDTGLEVDEYLDWKDAEWQPHEHVELAGYMPKSTSTLSLSLLGGVFKDRSPEALRHIFKAAKARRPERERWIKWSVVLEDGTSHIVDCAPQYDTAAKVHELIARDAAVQSVTRARDRSR